MFVTLNCTKFRKEMEAALARMMSLPRRPRGKKLLAVAAEAWGSARWQASLPSRPVEGEERGPLARNQRYVIFHLQQKAHCVNDKLVRLFFREMSQIPGRCFFLIFITLIFLPLKIVHLVSRSNVQPLRIPIFLLVSLLGIFAEVWPGRRGGLRFGQRSHLCSATDLWDRLGLWRVQRRRNPGLFFNILKTSLTK